MPKAASNPYAPGYPVAPRLFAGRRSALETIRRSFDASCDGHLTNVFIEGAWGIGKTSLLDKVRPELQERGPVVKEDVTVAGDQTRDFLIAILNELLGVAGISGDELDVSSGWDRRSIRRSLKAIWEALKDQGHAIVVITLDNLERARPEFLADVRDIFQSLRSEGARYMLIFAGKVLPIPGVSAADPTARFFQRLPIGPLEEDESVEAIQKPIQFGYEISFVDEAARLIHRRAAGHPYFLKAICSAVFEISHGRGVIDSRWLSKRWPEVEESLEVAKFGDEFKDLPEGEKETLLRASLLGATFEAKELRQKIKKSLDTYLRRLSADRGLLRRLPGHGTYEVYHPLFRTFLQAKARERKMKPPGHRRVEERRPVQGREEVEDIIRRAASKSLDLLDEHFRGRAVSFLEAAGAGVSIRVLMAPDPAWPKTLSALQEMHHDLRKRVEVRQWPKSDANPVPWHVRFLVGDREAWEISHSLDGIGKKTTHFTDKTVVRDQLARDFERWWKESRKTFPPESVP
ncbi:MAG: AAA family ATPase [Candidatus Eisenbacteria bacterium]